MYEASSMANDWCFSWFLRFCLLLSECPRVHKMWSEGVKSPSLPLSARFYQHFMTQDREIRFWSGVVAWNRDWWDAPWVKYGGCSHGEVQMLQDRLNFDKPRSFHFYWTRLGTLMTGVKFVGAAYEGLSWILFLIVLSKCYNPRGWAWSLSSMKGVIGEGARCTFLTQHCIFHWNIWFCLIPLLDTYEAVVGRRGDSG